MATRYWVSTSGDFTSATSWNTAPDGSGSSGAPANSDTLIFQAGSTNVTSNHDDITLTGLTIKIFGGPDGYRGQIGSEGTPMGWDATVNSGTTSIEAYSLESPLYLGGNTVSGGTFNVSVIGSRKNKAFVYFKEGTWDEVKFVDCDVKEIAATFTTQYVGPGTRLFADTGGSLGTIYVLTNKSENQTRILPEPYCEFRRKPAAIYAYGGTSKVWGTSGAIHIETLGDTAVVEYNGYDSFTETGGYHLVNLAGLLDFSKNTYDLGSTTLKILHAEGAKLNLMAPGTTIAFNSGSSKKIGRGSRTYQGTATITGFSGDTGGSGSGGFGA
jgi:hypothetical protein